MAVLKNLSGMAEDNDNFRRVVATGEHTQIVVMSIPPEGEIGEEVHEDNDQLIYLVDGEGTAVLEDEETNIAAGDAVLVPAGTKHNFKTRGQEAMKIITTYSPPHHPEGTVHATKADADAAEAHE